MKHCWHETGEASSTTFSYFISVVCCNCGDRSVRKYIEETEGLSGHGKYYSRRIMVPQPVEYEGGCEAKHKHEEDGG